MGKKPWHEHEHPRNPSGTPGAGEFAGTGGVGDDHDLDPRLFDDREGFIPDDEQDDDDKPRTPDMVDAISHHILTRLHIPDDHATRERQ